MSTCHHANAYSATNRHTHTYPHPPVNGHADADPAAHSRTCGHANAFPYSRANSDTDSGSHPHADGHPNIDWYADSTQPNR